MRKKILIVLAVFTMFFNAFACIIIPGDSNGISRTYSMVDNEIVCTVNNTINTVTQELVIIEVPSTSRSGDVIYLSLPAHFNLKINSLSSNNSINELKLQYLNTTQMNWITIKSFDEIPYSLSTTVPVPHFGINTINPAGFFTGDTLYVKVYFSDGIYEAEVVFEFVIDDNRRAY